LADVGLGNQTVEQFFKELLVVSQFIVSESSDSLSASELAGLSVNVERAQGTKCPRCWHYEEDKPEEALCNRCTEFTK
jgi:isoleucyl-tRNA synthetase